MFSKLSRYIAAAALAFLAGACADEIDVPQPELLPDSPGTITLRFRNSTASRSDDSDNAEIAIHSLYVGLYPDASNENLPAVAFVNKTVLTESQTATVTIQLSDQMIATLFDNTDGEKCYMYAVANYEENKLGDGDIPDNATIAQLKTLAVTSQFDAVRVPSSFVMAGGDDVTYTAGVAPDPGRATGRADLYRAAAKIRLNLDIPESITLGEGDNAETWYSQTNADAIRVYLNNGVKNCVAVPSASWTPAEADYFSNSSADYRPFSATGTGDFNQVMPEPFYTYPNTWTNSTFEVNKTYMTLMLPWGKRNDDNTYTYSTYYYQVPVTIGDLTTISPNTSYTINLRVGMLGSLTPEEPVEVPPVSYEAVNWSTQNVDVDIKDFRYLVVNPTQVFVNNEAEVLIPFYSSHPVTADNFSITYDRFAFITAEGNENMGKVVSFTIDEEQIDRSNTATDSILSWSIVKQNDQQMLRVKHPLTLWNPVNTAGTEVEQTGYTDLSDTTTVQEQIYRYVPTTQPAFSAYRIRVHLAHADNEKYDEDITITQYPPMYIEGIPNTSTATVVNRYVNGSTTDAGNFGSLSNILDPTSSAGNKNINMYVINVSQLNESSGYYIGDPRMTVINNSLAGTGDLTGASTAAATWSTSATALYPPELTYDIFPGSGLIWTGNNNGYTTTNMIDGEVFTFTTGKTNNNNNTANATQPEESQISLGRNNYINITSADFGFNKVVITLSQTSATNNFSVPNNSGWTSTRNNRQITLSSTTLQNSFRINFTGQNNLIITNIEVSYSGRRTLTYYYPTIESQDNQYKYMISPKFRVASSWGVTTPVTRANARRRAATYQEEDCPAGRWRLPTFGELQFIVNLSANGKIPTLFSVTSGDSKGYWTAQGVCRVNSDGTITLTDATTAAIRAVYDELYWEQYPEYSITATTGYRFGDIPRMITE